MGNQLAGGDEQSPVSLRVNSLLLKQFDDMVEESDHWSDRSDAIRDLMRGTVSDESSGVLDVPDDPDLARAYRTLVAERSPADSVPLRRAQDKLAQVLGVPKDAVYRTALMRLQERGYIRVNHAPPGHRGGTVSVRVIRR